MRSRGPCLLFAIVLAGGFTAVVGADELQSLSLETLAPGVAQPVTADMIAAPSAADGMISSPLWCGTAVLTQVKHLMPHARGPRDVSLFRDAAPSVVLIQTTQGLGSGSLLKENVILTNLHVVGTERQVTIVFNPSDPSGRRKDDEVSRA